jgi:CubicO group peptidase (beta-lactamase class C family)
MTDNQPNDELSIGVIKDGKVYKYNFGTKVTPTSQTIYEIGSITKTFTTYLLTKAVVDGKASLDDDIRKYLKEPYPNLEYQGTPVTLKNLVNWTSSLPNNIPDVTLLKDKFPADSIPREIVKLNEHYTKEDFLRDLHQVTLATKPGSTPAHSNAANQLLGFILENIYKMPYEVIVKKYITGPLNMSNTGITLTTQQLTRRAEGYDDKGLKEPHIPLFNGAAGAMKSCLDDMLKYIAFQLDESNPAVMMTHKAAWGDPQQFAIGLNWFLGTFEGKRRVNMDGTTFGFTSYCLLYPELHFGVMVMTNECVNNSSIQDKTEAIANKIFVESNYTPEERTDDAFGFSKNIKRLAKTGDTTGLDENEVNYWAYSLLRKGKSEYALKIFQLNTQLHPDSWNVYDSEAEAYEDMGDKANAVKFYKRSLELNPKNTNADDHLKKLGAL